MLSLRCRTTCWWRSLDVSSGKHDTAWCDWVSHPWFILWKWNRHTQASFHPLEASHDYCTIVAWYRLTTKTHPKYHVSIWEVKSSSFRWVELWFVALRNQQMGRVFIPWALKHDLNHNSRSTAKAVELRWPINCAELNRKLNRYLASNKWENDRNFEGP